VLTEAARTPNIAPPTIKMSRAERRRKQKKKQRRQRGSVVGVLAVVGAIVAAVVVVKAAGGGDDKTSAATVRTQTTLLFQIRGADNKAAASALLAHDPKPASGASPGVMLLVPSRVIADIPGRGSAPFGNALGLATSPTLSQATLTDLIGVTVDGTMAFTGATFVRFINNLGGIVADVDTDVVRTAKSGPSLVLVPSGDGQRLDGAAAFAYATYGTGPTQLPRVQHVLEGILAKLTAPTVFANAMRGLGTGAQLTMSVSRAGDLLTGVAADDRTNQIDVQSLDVKPVDTGGPAAYIIDAPRVREFVNRSLKASVPEGLLGGANRVLVKNGIGTPLLGTTTRERLLRAGFVYVDGGNVPGFPRRNATSVVLVFSTGPDAQARGTKVAGALGLPSADVQVSTLGQSVADVIVILGRDYKPLKGTTR
jgi:hypothetical protein